MKYTYYRNSECMLGPGPDPKKRHPTMARTACRKVRLPFTIVTSGLPLARDSTH